MKKSFKFFILIFLVLVMPFTLIACDKGDEDNTDDKSKDNETYYTISISQMENGSVYVNKSSALSGDTISLVIVPDEGYMLEEGSLKFNNTPISNKKFVMPSENVIIYASFVKESHNEEEPQSYTINYHVNEWTTHSNPTSFTEGTSTITLTNPTRKGFDFDGWYSDASYSNKITKIEFRKGNIDIYPKFNEIFELTGDGTDKTISGLTAYGETLRELVVPSTIDGYTIRDFAIQKPCNNVVTLSIEDGVKNIYAYLTLYNSQKLETVNLPKSIDIANYTAGLFRNCERLKTINLDSENPNIYLIDGVLYKDESGYDFMIGSYNYTYMVCYPNGLGNSIFSIPNNVTHLTDFGKAKFNKVVIPASVIEFCKTNNKDNPFSDCLFLNFMEVSSENEHFYFYNDMLIEDTSNSKLANNRTAKLIHALNTGRLLFDLSEVIIKEDIKYRISDIAGCAFDACVDLKAIIYSGPQLNVNIFSGKPNLKAFSKAERPSPTSWSEEDRYRAVLSCENIYWYSETNNSSQYKCWRYVNDDPLVW